MEDGGREEEEAARGAEGGVVTCDKRPTSR